MTRIAILDDYQNVALGCADWNTIPGEPEIEVFRKHIPGEEAVAVAVIRNPSRHPARVVTAEIGLPPGCDVDRRAVRGDESEAIEKGPRASVIYLDDLGPGANGDGGVEGAPGILIGRQLAGALGLRVGDPMLIISPVGGPRTPLGPAPRLFRFRVAGIFSSRFLQFDEVYTYTSLQAAQDFLSRVRQFVQIETEDFQEACMQAGLFLDMLQVFFDARGFLRPEHHEAGMA